MSATKPAQSKVLPKDIGVFFIYSISPPPLLSRSSNRIPCHCVRLRKGNTITSHIRKDANVDSDVETKGLGVFLS